MELVYLWVEDYKNIQNQGFNFSPRFTCKYEDAELTIDENKEHVSIFPENINVTAIVGENGSGKSSVLEVLSSLYMNIYINSKEDKSFTIYRDKKQFYLYCDNAKETTEFDKFINIVNKTQIASPNGFSNGADYKILYFSNCLTDMTNKKQFELFKSTAGYSFHNGFKPQNLLMKDDKNLADFEQKFSSILKDDNKFFDFLDDNLLFDSYKYEIHISELEAYLVGDNLFCQELSFRKENIEDKEKLFYRFLIVSLISETENLVFKSGDKRFNKDRPKPMKEYFKTEVADEIEDFSTENYDFVYYEKIKQICVDSLKQINEDTKISSLLLEQDKIKEIIDLYSLESKIKPTVHNEYEIGNEPPKETSADKIFKSKNFQLREEMKLNDFEKVLLRNNILRINFFDSRKTNCDYLSLSTGEQEYLKILTNISYSIKQSKEKKYLFLFDEIEISLHPNWQKKLISNIDSILKKLNGGNIHFILTSHSPFILSDLPKENVIFLKDGKQIHVDINTFGANIHTLLSHGFFMKDGLMGEFAKGKINEAIKLLNQKALSKEDMNFCENIILIIGEPILKRQLQKMLDSKRLTKIDAIDKNPWFT
ncbi:MAG: AAA family ATPase [Sulfurimonas sp.]|nr:AAA family ATPase [Sulfurimonas sp.]